MIPIRKTWTVPRITGYKPLTNYWDIFTQLEINNNSEKETLRAIKKAFKELLPEARTDYKKFTELVMILNHKCWDHHDLGYYTLSQWYSNEYQRQWDWGLNHIKDEQEFSYYLSTLD